MKTAKLIKTLRKAVGITQLELAEAIKLNGNVGSQLISNIERGICLPPFNRVAAFAQALRCNPKLIYGAMLGDEIMRVNAKYEDFI